MTSRDQVWVIPKETPFKAIGDKGVKEYTCDEDLVVMHKGSLLDLNKDANRKAVSNKKKVAYGGGAVSLLAIIATLLRKQGFKIRDLKTVLPKKKKGAKR